MKEIANNGYSSDKSNYRIKNYWDLSHNANFNNHIRK